VRKGENGKEGGRKREKSQIGNKDKLYRGRISRSRYAVMRKRFLSVIHLLFYRVEIVYF